jgi:hypothetical protein
MISGRRPGERHKPRIEFLAEQDGPSERELKALLRVECADSQPFQRAYLA